MTTEERVVLLTRETAALDAYTGLRRIGYTTIGAMRALRALGLSLREAKAAADIYSDRRLWEGKPDVPEV